VGTVAAYIDGFNLYYSMKNKYGRKYLWLDLVKLAGHLRPEDEVVQVRYFTTIVRGEPAAAANQIHYVDALRAHSGGVLDIQIGWFKRRTLSPCKLCGEHWQCECPRRPRSFEEKETDVALAVSMVEDAAAGIADRSCLNRSTTRSVGRAAGGRRSGFDVGTGLVSQVLLGRRRRRVAGFVCAGLISAQTKPARALLVVASVAV
jgi:hypothetical protein